MKITVNGESQVTQASNLQELVKRLGYGESKIAAAFNGSFVPHSQYINTLLSEGDDIEIVAPMQGG
ncbi:sulfur carrier protein ThiS [Alteromonadaceae bacterium M269]|nr:sulfur carrier protein ThiS [Alteromonadaceae bacterium M269]